MKRMKFLSLAALALTFAACSSNDDELTQQPAEQPANNNMITITAKLAPKSGSAQTRAVSDDGTNIVVNWAKNENIAILYTVGSQKLLSEAEITDVDASGVATITFAVDGSTADNTACTLVYPSTATDQIGKSGPKAYNVYMATQTGQLYGYLDVRVGAGTIHTSTPSLDVTTQPEAQYSIFKFTLQDVSGSAITYSMGLTELKVSDDGGNVITTVHPTTNALYVGLPVLAAGTYWFNATVSGKPYIAKATLSTPTSAGNYYQSTMEMATIGNVIASDGKFYAHKTATPGGNTAMAVITYLGSATGETSYTHGLALAMQDANGGAKCQWSTLTSSTVHSYVPNNFYDFGSQSESGLQYNDVTHNSNNYPAFKAAMANNGNTAPTGFSAWFLPTSYQWSQMIEACKGLGNAPNNDYRDLRERFSGVGGKNLNISTYWVSTEQSAKNAWKFTFASGIWANEEKNVSGVNQCYVRSALAF
jgi:hypothetical protein